MFGGRSKGGVRTELIQEVVRQFRKLSYLLLCGLCILLYRRKEQRQWLASEAGLLLRDMPRKCLLTAVAEACRYCRHFSFQHFIIPPPLLIFAGRDWFFSSCVCSLVTLRCPCLLHPVPRSAGGDICRASTIPLGKAAPLGTEGISAAQCDCCTLLRKPGLTKVPWVSGWKRGEKNLRNICSRQKLKQRNQYHE